MSSAVASHTTLCPLEEVSGSISRHVPSKASHALVLRHVLFTVACERQAGSHKLRGCSSPSDKLLGSLARPAAF
jgi:hypothetical protein